MTTLISSKKLGVYKIMRNTVSLLVVFEASKVNVPQVAVFDKKMAVGKSENLVMLHVHKLEKDRATSF